MQYGRDFPSRSGDEPGCPAPCLSCTIAVCSPASGPVFPATGLALSVPGHTASQAGSMETRPEIWTSSSEIDGVSSSNI